MKFTNAFSVAYEFPYETPLQRLIMVKIVSAGSCTGQGERLIYDDDFLSFCCCDFDEFNAAMIRLIEMCVLHKINYGYQYGKPISGYVISDFAEAREKKA